MKGFLLIMKFIKTNENKIDEKVLQSLSLTYNLDKSILEILFQRGIDSEEKLRQFLYADINDLKDPFLLLNMTKTIDRIMEAIEKKEKILIFGDYDVDGICSTSILYLFLKTKTPNIYTYIPNRLEDGYGLSCPCIDKIAEREKPNLIITVDCGISCVNEIDYIKNLGIDVIVTDHHELPQILPKTTIVNTKFDQDFGFKGLCGAGVSFKIVQALCYKFNENFEKYLPICALATIADIVPLKDENRIIVKEGLKRLKMLPTGVKILLKSCLGTLDNVKSNDIAFKVAPMINSAGRIDDANVALNLFVSEDLKVINDSLKKLEFLNEKRKKLCENILKDAKKLLNNKNIGNVIILYKENWDIGVLGIVCARLCEEYNRPTILLGKNGDLIKGSARSINNIDIYKLLSNSQDILENFGGHKKAGGLSLKQENLKRFITRSQEFLQKNYTEKDYEVIKNYDLEIEKSKINVDFVEKIDILEPFGFENPFPIVRTTLFDVQVQKMKNHPEHISMQTGDITILSFNDEKSLDYFNFFNEKDVLLELSVNCFKKKKSVKAILKSVNFFGLNKEFEKECAMSYLLQFETQDTNTAKVKRYTSLKQLESIISPKTLIISYCPQDENLSLISNFSKKIFTLDENDLQVILFSPKSNEKFNRFNKIIFLQTPVCFDYVNKISKNFKGSVYLPLNDVFPFNLSCDRETLLEIFGSLKSILKQKNVYKNFRNLYNELEGKYKISFSFEMFFTSILIFKELKLISLIENDSLKITINNIKTDLSNSCIYKKINNL